MRTLYEKYIEWDPTNSASWIKYAELETQLEDFSRTRGIFELGITQQQLSMPEVLWKAYIDFEVEEGEREKARELYERLVAMSGHFKVWISYALFEAEPINIPRSQREELEEEEEGWGDREFVSDMSESEDGLSDLEDAFVRLIEQTSIHIILTASLTVIARRRLFRGWR